MRAKAEIEAKVREENPKYGRCTALRITEPGGTPRGDNRGGDRPGYDRGYDRGHDRGYDSRYDRDRERERYDDRERYGAERGGWAGDERYGADRGYDRDRERGGYHPYAGGGETRPARSYSARDYAPGRRSQGHDGGGYHQPPRGSTSTGGWGHGQHPPPARWDAGEDGYDRGGGFDARAPRYDQGWQHQQPQSHAQYHQQQPPPQQQQQTYGAPAYQQRSTRTGTRTTSSRPRSSRTPRSSIPGWLRRRDAAAVPVLIVRRRRNRRCRFSTGLERLFGVPADDASSSRFFSRRWMDHRSCALLRALRDTRRRLPPSRPRRFGRFRRRAGLFEIVPSGRATRDGQPRLAASLFGYPYLLGASPLAPRLLARPRVPTPSATPPSRALFFPTFDFLARRNSRDRDPRPRPPTGPSSSWSAAEASPADASRRGVTPPPSWDALPARGPRAGRSSPSLAEPPSRIAAARGIDPARAYAPPKPRTRPARARETVTTAVSVWAVSRTTRLARSRSRARPSRRASARPDMGGIASADVGRPPRGVPTGRLTDIPRIPGRFLPSDRSPGRVLGQKSPGPGSFAARRAASRAPRRRRAPSSGSYPAPDFFLRRRRAKRLVGPKFAGTGFVRGASRGVVRTPDGSVPRAREGKPARILFPRRRRRIVVRPVFPRPGLSAPRLATSNAPPGASRPVPRAISTAAAFLLLAASNAASNSPGPGVDAARRAASKTPRARRASRLGDVHRSFLRETPGARRRGGTPRRRVRRGVVARRETNPDGRAGCPRADRAVLHVVAPAPARAPFSISTVFAPPTACAGARRWTCFRNPAPGAYSAGPGASPRFSRAAARSHGRLV